MSILRLCIFNFQNILSRRMQYRFDFIVGILVTVGIAFAEPIIQLLFFKGVHGYQGWNFEQITVFQGVMLVWLGLKDSLFGEVRSSFQTMVKDGSFDRLLNKPYSPLILIFTGGFNVWGLATLVAGLTMLSYIINLNRIHLEIWEILFCIIFAFSGLIFYCAILIVYCAILIHLVAMNRLEELLDKLLRLGEYPLNIFPGGVQWMLTLLLPLMLWIYYPTQTILHRLDHSAFISVLASIVLFFVSIKIFNLSLKKYSSAGG